MGKLINTFFVTAVKALIDFKKFRLGPRTGKKDMDNAHQARSHAHRFCNYMLVGCSTNAGMHDLTFLNQIDRLRV